MASPAESHSLHWAFAHIFSKMCCGSERPCTRRETQPGLPPCLSTRTYGRGVGESLWSDFSSVTHGPIRPAAGRARCPQAHPQIHRTMTPAVASSSSMPAVAIDTAILANAPAGVTGFYDTGGGGLTQGRPPIALTANALRDEEVHCREAGIDAYLTKPCVLPSSGRRSIPACGPPAR